MEFTTLMSVKELLAYREFNRVDKPAPQIPFCQQYTVAEVVGWLQSNDGNIPEPLELSICDDKALLTDGNHRIAAAEIIGIKQVPVKVTYYTKESLSETFYPHTIERFKTIQGI